MTKLTPQQLKEQYQQKIMKEMNKSYEEWTKRHEDDPEEPEVKQKIS